LIAHQITPHMYTIGIFRSTSMKIMAQVTIEAVYSIVSRSCSAAREQD